jgi:hypothetical protein
MFPFTVYNLFDACFAQTIPSSPESGFAHGFKGFVDEDASRETT